jgi:hypothetical protein
VKTDGRLVEHVERAGEAAAELRAQAKALHLAGNRDPKWYDAFMTSDDEGELAELPADARAWIVADERRWRKARRIAADHPGMDAGGVYRVLRNLEKSPAERLRAALDHGRLFRAHAR